ncbi:hypothetical protein [Rossellomorea sp. BNER]|uniref:hypothetical protein n=1 Tax=Rossellomorea sp. BNER TaxID=2962031 RepID=UPI003AF21471|nr:hypothetical protein [Rossellomorea sp. BNER]
MSWKEDYINLNIISQEVTRIINDLGDEIELEITQFCDHYCVIATICQEQPPYKDYIAFGQDAYSKQKAMDEALRELYTHAYSFKDILFHTSVTTPQELDRYH